MSDGDDGAADGHSCAPLPPTARQRTPRNRRCARSAPRRGNVSSSPASTGPGPPPSPLPWNGPLRQPSRAARGQRRKSRGRRTHRRRPDREGRRRAGQAAPPSPRRAGSGLHRGASRPYPTTAVPELPPARAYADELCPTWTRTIRSRNPNQATASPSKTATAPPSPESTADPDADDAETCSSPAAAAVGRAVNRGAHRGAELGV